MPLNTASSHSANNEHMVPDISMLCTPKSHCVGLSASRMVSQWKIPQPADTHHHEDLQLTCCSARCGTVCFTGTFPACKATSQPASLQGSFYTRQMMSYAGRTSPLGLCTPAKPSLQRSPTTTCQNPSRAATAVGKHGVIMLQRYLDDALPVTDIKILEPVKAISLKHDSRGFE